MVGIVGAMKQVNLIRRKMETNIQPSYDKVNPEDIIAKLKQILAYLETKSKEKLKDG